MGSCVDNSRILTVLTQMATEGGLGDDISDMPAVGMAPEWMSEKALAIAPTAPPPAPTSSSACAPSTSRGGDRILSKEWEETLGGKLEFVPEAEEIVRKTLEHIDKKRAALKLPVYDAEPLRRLRRQRHAAYFDCRWKSKWRRFMAKDEGQGTWN